MAPEREDLSQKHCTPCEGGEDPLDEATAKRLVEQVDGWRLAADQRSIDKEWTRKDFQDALRFVNAVGEVAEAEGHHPDILLHGYKKVRLTLATHAIGGLSENDFIVAAKVDTLDA